MLCPSNLSQLGKMYPPGDLEDPTYAIAGGSAVLCWLHDEGIHRQHHDIDLFAFNPQLLKVWIGSDLPPLFSGSFSEKGIAFGAKTETIDLQIIQKSYFHSEIIPTLDNIRSVSIQDIHLLSLSPEFLIVSKLSYPCVHRPYDFQDVLALNQQMHLQASEVTSLLEQTSLGKFMDPHDILRVKTWEDLQTFVLSIQRHMIRRFLHRQDIRVELLDPCQLFVLLDIEDEAFELPSNVIQFVASQLAGATSNVEKRQIARLGLYLLLMGIPAQYVNGLLEHPEFQLLVTHLVFKNPAHWLTNAKTVQMTLKRIMQIEELLGYSIEFVWHPTTLLGLIESTFFKGPSIFSLLAPLQAILFDLQRGNMRASDCIAMITRYLQVDRPVTELKPSTYKAYPWIFARRRNGGYPSHTSRGGKWMLFVSVDEIDEVWKEIAYEVEQGSLGGLAKASTTFERSNRAITNQRVICVYTYDSTDEEDVGRILHKLCQMKIARKPLYKTDRSTMSVL